MKKRVQKKVLKKKISKRFTSGYMVLGFGKKIIYKKKNFKNICSNVGKMVLIKKTFNELSDLLGKKILRNKLEKRELFLVRKKI